MRLARRAFFVTLTSPIPLWTAAQTMKRDGDHHNQAPTVGTGGTPGGPTGLFTIYDGATLCGGEVTFSTAYSNYDRDPGNSSAPNSGDPSVSLEHFPCPTLLCRLQSCWPTCGHGDILDRAAVIPQSTLSPY